MITENYIFRVNTRISENPDRLNAMLWLPDNGSPERVIHVIHGMTEHIGRYERFAQVMTDNGIAVAGFDLLGHGRNPGNPEVAAFNRHSWLDTLSDMQEFHEDLLLQFPEAKHYMLGFSLGSFLLREYLGRYNCEKLAGAIIMGTGYQPSFILKIMQGVVSGQVRKVGYTNTTRLVRELSFGTYNKKFAPNATSADWLCSDEEKLNAYLSDPLCRQNISSGLFYELLKSMERTGSIGIYKDYDMDMPILLLSGANDPVGDMSKGVKTVCKQMRKAGMKNVSLALLENARHDILHEYSSGASNEATYILLKWLEKN